MLQCSKIFGAVIAASGAAKRSAWFKGSNGLLRGDVISARAQLRWSRIRASCGAARNAMRAPKPLQLSYQIRRDLGDAADTEQRHVAVDFIAEQRQRMPYAGFA